MTPFLLLILAVALSIALIPLMIRLAPRLGMIDTPHPRKIHLNAIPRVGGWGIVLGALVSVTLLLPITPLLKAYLTGAVVLFAFGVLDDAFQLGHYPKFAGQILAVSFPILMGDFSIERLPFFDQDTIPPEIGIPFTYFAMIGMINAINHSDGLDGLAGGESLLSLLVITFLAYLADGETAVGLCAAIIGGIFGFLKFNNYPARVFMGDSGSTFLGYSLGFLCIYLTQHVHTALSPAVPLLLLGLPIIDILAVLAQRIYHGLNWFKATKNHIHHRLLMIGFDHYETVVIIYSIQTLFVTSGVLMRYESDMLITAFYLSFCLVLFVFLFIAERTDWNPHKRFRRSHLSMIARKMARSRLLNRIPVFVIFAAIPSYLVYGSMCTDSVPLDFGIGSILLLFGLVMDLTISKGKITTPLRGIVYITAIFIVYLMAEGQPDSYIESSPIELWYFVTVAAATAWVVRFGNHESFGTTPMDFLLILGVIAIVIFSRDSLEEAQISLLIVKGMIMMYACELLLSVTSRKLNALTVSVLISLSILGFRGSVI